jgi:hypothetical protein
MNLEKIKHFFKYGLKEGFNSKYILIIFGPIEIIFLIIFLFYLLPSFGLFAFIIIILMHIPTIILFYFCQTDLQRKIFGSGPGFASGSSFDDARRKVIEQEMLEKIKNKNNLRYRLYLKNYFLFKPAKRDKIYITILIFLLISLIIWLIIILFGQTS